MTLLPTFIIPGAPKSGTTALCRFIREHPQVAISRIKEPRFFSEACGELERGIAGSGAKRSGRFHMGFEWYSSLFEHAPHATARGDASTHYFSGEDSPRLIASYVPDVKLVIMLRDPIARLYSQYWQEYQLGWDFPDFRTMMRENHPRFQNYSWISSYRPHLERFRSCFAPEQLMILRTEELMAAPRLVTTRVLEFLGVDANVELPRLGQRVERKYIPRSRWLARSIEIARFRVARFLPAPLRATLGRARKAVKNLNSVPEEYPPLLADLRAELMPRFEEHIAYVEDLLKVDLPAWRRVSAQ